MKDKNFVVDLNKKCPYCNHTDKQSNKGCTTSGNKRYYCSYCKKSYTYITHLKVNNELPEKTVSLQCPYCDSTENQVFKGYNNVGNQRGMCKSCNKVYVIYADAETNNTYRQDVKNSINRKPPTSLTCPHCSDTKNQSKAGYSSRGYRRGYCKLCKKGYIIYPKQISEDVKKTYQDKQAKHLVDTILDEYIKPSDNLVLMCPNCHDVENQIKKGFDKNGNQKCKCKNCDKEYITTIKDITAEPVTKKSNTKWNTSCPKCHNRIWQTISKYYSDGKFGCRCNCCGYEYVEDFKQMSTQLETALRALNKLKDKYPETKVTIQYKGQELTVELDEITIFSKDDLNIIFGLK